MGMGPIRRCPELVGGLWLDAVPHRVLCIFPKIECWLAGLEPGQRLGVCGFPVEYLVKSGTINGCDDRDWIAAMSQEQSLAPLDALDYGTRMLLQFTSRHSPHTLPEK